MLVEISEKDIRRFNRLTWESYRVKREYFEFIFGRFDKRTNTASVGLLWPVEHYSTMQAVYLPDEAWDEAEEDARGLGMEVLGSVHTHLTWDTCCHASGCDIGTDLSQGHKVSAIVHAFQRKGEKTLKWNFFSLWEPVTAIKIP